MIPYLPRKKPVSAKEPRATIKCSSRTQDNKEENWEVFNAGEQGNNRKYCYKKESQVYIKKEGMQPRTRTTVGW